MNIHTNIQASHFRTKINLVNTSQLYTMSLRLPPGCSIVYASRPAAMMPIGLSTSGGGGNATSSCIKAQLCSTSASPSHFCYCGCFYATTHQQHGQRSKPCLPDRNARHAICSSRLSNDSHNRCIISVCDGAPNDLHLFDCHHCLKKNGQAPTFSLVGSLL